VLSDSPTFARHHKLRLPKAKEGYSLGGSCGDGTYGDVLSAVPREARAGEPPLVVKELKEGISLADRVGALQRALSGSPNPDWPKRLLAFPFSIVVADFEGDEREGIFMLDLTELGYENAEPYFQETPVQEYQRRPVHERVEFAQSYAGAAAVLEGIRFLHGDQNLPNLMLNPDTFDAQIVDLDAGAILVTGNERADPEGKGDACVPPDVTVRGSNGFRIDKSLWDTGAERWSIGSLVGYLSFGIHPAFLLLRMSASIVDAYAEEGPWPRIDPQSPHAPPGIKAILKHWQPVLEAAPGRLTETFVAFFRAGTRGSERPTAQDWVDALEAARQKPQFLSFEIAPAVAPESTEVVISWEAEGADRVEHPELGELSPAGEATLVVERSARHTLIAVNYYGRATASALVRAVPLPKLRTIPLSGFPGLELQATIATAAPPRAVPGFPPRLAQAIPIPPAERALPRGPRPTPSPPRFGQIFRPIPNPRRIRTMMRKEPTE
jgi:hypothetical protein